MSFRFKSGLLNVLFVLAVLLVVGAVLIGFLGFSVYWVVVLGAGGVLALIVTECMYDRLVMQLLEDDE